MQNVQNIQDHRQLTHTEKQITRIKQYQQNNANMIMLCDPYNLPELHRIEIGIVQLDPNPQGADVYPARQKKGHFHLHAAAKIRFQFAAGVQWDPEHTGPVTSTRDYCHCSAVGIILSSYGKPIPFRGDAEMDMITIKEDLVKEYTKKAKGFNPPKGQEYIDFCVDRDHTFKRTHKIKLTSTSAKGVVIDKLLNLRSSYSEQEIRQPFVVVRTIVAPDLSDPETQKAIQHSMVQAITGVYGNQKQIAAAPVNAEPPIDIQPEPAPEPDSRPGMEPDPSFNQGQPEPDADFIHAERSIKLATVKSLASKKGFDLSTLRKPLENGTDDQLLGLYRKIKNYVPAVNEEDIPY